MNETHTDYIFFWIHIGMDDTGKASLDLVLSGALEMQIASSEDGAYLDMLACILV